MDYMPQRAIRRNLSDPNLLNGLDLPPYEGLVETENGDRVLRFSGDLTDAQMRALRRRLHFTPEQEQGFATLDTVDAAVREAAGASTTMTTQQLTTAVRTLARAVLQLRRAIEEG